MDFDEDFDLYGVFRPDIGLYSQVFPFGTSTTKIKGMRTQKNKLFFVRTKFRRLASETSETSVPCPAPLPLGYPGQRSGADHTSSDPEASLRDCLLDG